MSTKLRNATLRPGKSEFNRFAIKDKTIEPCICKYNLDFNEGCISNLNPYFKDIKEIFSKSILSDELIFDRLDTLLQTQLSTTKLNPEIRFSCNFTRELQEYILVTIQKEVFDYLKFEKEFINRYFNNQVGLLDGKRNGCKYCYAHYKNNSQKVLIDSMDFKNLCQQLDKIPTKNRIIRLDKDSECMSIFHLDFIHELLDICIQYDAKIIAPTKFLYYEPTIAKQLKKTGSVIGYSLSHNDLLEPGPSLYGFDSDYRLHCAKKYADQGVNIVLKIALDCTQSFKDCDKANGNIYKYVQFLTDNPHIGKQLIPLRIHRKDVALTATGHTKLELLSGIQNMFGNSIDRARYIPYFSGSIIPDIIHDDFKQFFGKNICGKIGHTFYCDSCNFKSLPKWKLNTDDIIPVKKTVTKRSQRREKKVIDDQPSLFDKETK